MCLHTQTRTHTHTRTHTRTHAQLEVSPSPQGSCQLKSMCLLLWWLVSGCLNPKLLCTSSSGPPAYQPATSLSLAQLLWMSEQKDAWRRGGSCRIECSTCHISHISSLIPLRHTHMYRSVQGEPRGMPLEESEHSGGFH